MTDQFSMYDAAYLLGALSPQERAQFEAHLSECRDCTRSVNQLAGMPGLLASVSPDKTLLTSDEPPVPDTLLPRLLAEVERTRFRRRWTLVATGLAAAVVLVVGLVVQLSGNSPLGSAHQPSVSAAALRMSPVSPGEPIHASAVLADTSWGTKITIWCTYDGVPGEHLDGPFTYTLVVTDTSGATQQVAAWSAKAGQPVVLNAASSVPKTQIASVQVRGPSDMPLLTLRP